MPKIIKPFDLSEEDEIVQLARADYIKPVTYLEAQAIRDAEEIELFELHIHDDGESLVEVGDQLSPSLRYGVEL